MQQFLSARGALAHADIERKAGAHFDRVTIYRTLLAFEEKGIIHTIPTTDGSIKYALCKDDCSEGHHHHHHIHLVCNVCHQTFCLDEVMVPILKLPKGYEISEVEIIVKGQCKKCKAMA